MALTHVLSSPFRSKRRVLAALLLPPLLLVLYVVLAPLPSGSTAGRPGTVVLASDGTVLQRDLSAGIRIPVRLDQVAPLLVQATIAAEDQRFRHHPGVDPVASLRAAAGLLVGKRSGASTITQQLAREQYLAGSDEPLVVRKLHEQLLALQLERHLSKDQILQQYLDATYYGRGAYGAEAAARVYFGVSAANLDLAQAAFLAGLPQSPGRYGADLEAAKGRQRYVLGRMTASGVISDAEASAAEGEELRFAADLQPAIAPHFAALALEELARVRPDLAGHPGLVVESTLDAGLQQEAERVARLRVDELARRNVTNAAVTAIEPATGRIRALVGSLDPAAAGGQIDMATEPRQPGSALKPFLYAAAFERGYTAATPLLDIPSTFQSREGPYTPENYDRKYHGVVPLRVALASSYNIPAVRTLDALGIDAFLEVAHRFGLRTLTDAESYGLALTLGGGEVRLLDLTGAYAALANEGVLVAPYAIERVRDASGRVLYEHTPDPGVRVLSPARAYVIADILADPAARVPGFGEVNPLMLPFPAAAKTGTTTGWRDNWTLGFTRDIAIGVWVGNTDGSAMVDISGVDGAGPIWHDLMATAGAGTGWLPRPDGIDQVQVCAPTGLLPGPDCPFQQDELFVRGTEPVAEERYYSRGPLGEVLIDPPAEARAWALQAGLDVVTAPGARGGGVTLLQPVAGAVLYLSPELTSQQLLMRASVPAGAERIWFRVDGQAAGSAPPGDAAITWQLEPGTHHVEVRADMADGTALTTISSYEVRQR